MNAEQQQEPRLPQIDPVTFSALNTLDTFIARAPLTRAEHAEANKSLQHLVQTIELLQGALRQMNQAQPAPGGYGSNPAAVDAAAAGSSAECSGNGRFQR